MLDKLFDSFVTVRGAHIAVVGAGRSAALDVSENRDTAFEIETSFDHLLHLCAGDGFALAVARALGNDDDVVAASGLLAVFEKRAEFILPALLRRTFGNEDPGGASGDCAHQSEIAAVASHDFHDENALMAVRGAAERVDGVGDAVQSGVRADGHIGVRHIVVDGADEPDDPEIGADGAFSFSDAVRRDEFLAELFPELTEFICTGETAVAADDDETADSAVIEIFRRGQEPFVRAERLAPGGSDDGSAFLHDARDRSPVHENDVVFDESLIALIDGVDIHIVRDSGANDGADRSVHTGCVAAACEHGDCFLLSCGIHSRTSNFLLLKRYHIFPFLQSGIFYFSVNFL